MKRQAFLGILGLLLFNQSCIQHQQGYPALIREAQKLYEDCDYLRSGEKYSEAFVHYDSAATVSDRYDAACAYALAHKVDSAFVQLFKISKEGNYANYARVRTAPGLKHLHPDQRWEEVLDKVKSNKITLMATLDTILQDDQKYRM